MLALCTKSWGTYFYQAAPCTSLNTVGDLKYTDTPKLCKKSNYLLVSQRNKPGTKKPHYNGRKVQAYGTLLLWHLACQVTAVTWI